MEIGRRRPAHYVPVGRYNCPTILLVTVCTKDRRPVLANAGMMSLLESIWKERALAWKAGRFVLMPDHLHVFCGPATWPGRPVKDWVSYWKRLATEGSGEPIWQDDFWDRQLRREDHYGNRWEYVRQNPVRAGLTSTPEEWPWQGEAHFLPW